MQEQLTCDGWRKLIVNKHNLPPLEKIIGLESNTELTTLPSPTFYIQYESHQCMKNIQFSQYDIIAFFGTENRITNRWI